MASGAVAPAWPGPAHFRLGAGHRAVALVHEQPLRAWIDRRDEIAQKISCTWVIHRLTMSYPLSNVRGDISWR